MKKTLGLIFVVIGALGLASCNKKNKDDANKIKIIYRSWDYGTEGQDNEERRLIKAFEDSHPTIKIQICENVSSGNFYWDDIRASIASGIECADVFMIPNMDWPLSSQYLLNIKSMTDADPEFGKVLDSVKSACSFKSGVYALPARLNYQGYFVNTTIVDRELGIQASNLNVNSPYSAIENIVDTAYGNPSIVGLNSAAHFIDTMPSVLDTTGTYGYYTWDGSNYHINDPAFIESVHKAQDLYNAKKTLDAYSDADKEALGLDPEVDPMVDAWNKGKLAIRHGYTYEIPDMLEKNTLNNSYKFIGNPGGKITIVGDYYGIFKNTAHPQEAYEFAKYMSFGSEGFKKRMELYAEKGALNSMPMTDDEDVVDKFFEYFGDSSVMSGLTAAFEYAKTKSMVEGVKTIVGFNAARFNKKTGLTIGETENMTVFEVLNQCVVGGAEISSYASQLDTLVNKTYADWMALYGELYE